MNSVNVAESLSIVCTIITMEAAISLTFLISVYCYIERYDKYNVSIDMDAHVLGRVYFSRFRKVFTST